MLFRSSFIRLRHLSMAPAPMSDSKGAATVSRVAQAAVLSSLQGLPSVVHIAVRHDIDALAVNWCVTHAIERYEQTVAMKRLEIVKADLIATFLGCFDEALRREQIVLDEGERH